MQLQSNDSRQLELPAELDGYAITTKKSIPLPFIVFLLCVSIGVLLVCKGYSDLHKAGQKRNQELMQAYPSFVDLLSLYMGAGLTVKGALLKIVTMTDSRILSEEINYTLNEIRSGIPETEGYYRLGNRLELPVYLKMMTLLSQKRYKRYPEYACRGRTVSTSVETGTCKEERRGGRNPTVVSYDITTGRCNDYRDSACTDGILKNTIIGSILSGL